MTWAVYACETAGFFLQFFPCAVLCFLPFDRGKLRLSPAKLYATLFLAAAAMSAAFPLVLHALPWESRFELSMAANSYMMAAILLGVAFYILLVRDTLVKKLLVVYVVLLYASAVYWMQNLFSPPMDPLWNDGIYAYNPYHVLFLSVVQAPLFPLLCLFMRRKVHIFLEEIGPERARAEFRFATASTAVFLALMMLGDSASIPNIIYPLPILNQALIYWMLFSETVLRSREEDTRRALEAQRLQVEHIRSDMARAARMHHDMRHHYSYLYSMAKTGTREELVDYLSSLVSQTEIRENQVFCEDPTVNALLQYYVGKARDEGIDCRVAADCPVLRIQPEDLTVLIGNIFENAIAACREWAGGGHIEAAVGLVHGTLTLVVTNSCGGVMRADTAYSPSGYLPASAFRSPREGGGNGLGSVDAVAKKYGGTAAFRYDDSARSFTSRVILNRV